MSSSVKIDNENIEVIRKEIQTVKFMQKQMSEKESEAERPAKTNKTTIVIDRLMKKYNSN